MSPRPRGGFTLVEILVVILIIGLLVGLVIPGLRLAMQAMDSTTCLSNMRQIALAMANYGADNKVLAGNAFEADPVKHPPWITVTADAQGKQTIGGVLYKYVETNPRVFICPTLKADTDVGGDKVACHYAIPTILSGMPPEYMRDGFYRDATHKLPGVPIVVEPQVYAVRNAGGNITSISNSLGVYDYQATRTWTTLPNGAFEGGNVLDRRRHYGRMHMAFANGTAGAFNFDVDEVAASDLFLTLANGTQMNMGGHNQWEDWSRR